MKIYYFNTIIENLFLKIGYHFIYFDKINILITNNIL